MEQVSLLQLAGLLVGQHGATVAFLVWHSRQGRVDTQRAHEAERAARESHIKSLEREIEHLKEASLRWMAHDMNRNKE